jgi:hypothetical protein
MKPGDIVVLKDKKELKESGHDYEWGETSPGRRFGFYLRDENYVIQQRAVGASSRDINDDDLCLLLGWDDTGNLAHIMNPRQEIGYVHKDILKVLS